jgi:hypothetical protein
VRILSLIFSLSLFLNAVDVYYAKLEPIETYNIKALVSGKVVFVNNKLEGLIAKNDIVVKFDDTVDLIDLKQTKKKLNTIKQIIMIEKNTLNKFNKIRSKSQLDKDNQKIKILNLQNQENDLITKIAILKDKIKNKTFIEKNRYIYNITVKTGEFVNIGSLIYQAIDITKGKLEIFLPIDKIKDYQKKQIYLNGKKTNYRINKVYKIADTKHITAYKCEIIVRSPNYFSQLVKIEFK